MRHIVTLCCVILFSRYFIAVLFAEEAYKKKTLEYGIFFGPLHVYKEENLRLTIYKTEIVRARRRARYCF